MNCKGRILAKFLLALLPPPSGRGNVIPWNAEEVAAVVSVFKEEIEAGITPKKRDILKKVQGITALHRRNWTCIKFYVRNRIVKNKNAKQVAPTCAGQQVAPTCADTQVAPIDLRCYASCTYMR